MSLERSGSILSHTLKTVADRAKPGVNLKALNTLAEATIKNMGGTLSFKGFKGYPYGSCLSVNQAVVHGLPTEEELKAGDILGIDLGVGYHGWYTDAATTIPIGKVSREKRELIRSTLEALKRAVALVKPGIRVGVLSYTIEAIAKQYGFSVIKALTGHGIGRHVHEPPAIPNWGSRQQGPILRAGQVIAIEPMFTTGSGDIVIADDGWTVLVSDGIGSHHEATVLTTKTGHQLLTEIIT